MPDPAALRGADHLVAGLQRLGVRTVFSLSGNQIMPVFDALIDSDIRLVHTRHEGAAVYMAEAYARVTGEIGVALLTAGPGFANGVSAIYSAFTSETPLLVLSGDAPLKLAGRDPFQAMDQQAIARTVCKGSFVLSMPGTMGHDIERAAHQATHGRAGPVHLSLPDDVLRIEAAAEEASGSVQEIAATPSLSRDDLGVVRDHLAQAAQPIVAFGPQFCRSHFKDNIAAVSERCVVPAYAFESPRGLRAPRLGAFAQVLEKADLIVLVGKKADFQVGYASPPAVREDCRVLMVDPDANVLAQARERLGARLIGAIHGCASELLEALAGSQLAINDEAARRAWRTQCDNHVNWRPQDWAEGAAASAPLHAGTVASELNRFLEGQPHSSLVVDGGEAGQWGQAFADAVVSLTNGPSGAIGGSLPYAIAAKAARPTEASIALMGDGTAGFYFMEFETALREELPVVVIVCNDARWNAEHQIQIREFGADRTMGCDMANLRFDEMVRGLGGYGENVTDRSEIVPAIERAIASGKPACLNIEVQSVPAPNIRYPSRS